MTIYSKTYETMASHSAKNMGSGGLDVLATPALVSFMENAAYCFAKDSIDDSQFTTVGTEIGIQHVKASSIGQNVTIVITALKEEGRKFDFRIEAIVGEHRIAKACHTRVKVGIDEFLKKIN